MGGKIKMIYLQYRKGIYRKGFLAWLRDAQDWMVCIEFLEQVYLSILSE